MLRWHVWGFHITVEHNENEIWKSLKRKSRVHVKKNLFKLLVGLNRHTLTNDYHPSEYFHIGLLIKRSTALSYVRFLRWSMESKAHLPPPHTQRERTAGFMASDRKSIERTFGNPTITLSANEGAVIQSLGPYLSKTDFRLYDQKCFSSWRKTLCSSSAFQNSFAPICRLSLSDLLPKVFWMLAEGFRGFFCEETLRPVTKRFQRQIRNCNLTVCGKPTWKRINPDLSINCNYILWWVEGHNLPVTLTKWN